jgi:CheY-like chemotaxis protein
LDAVFDPFVQAVETSDLISGQSPEGTGLGLSISRKFVRLMGGDLTVRSELGVGSHFHFSVVVGTSEDDEIPITMPKREVIGLAPDQPAYRLLVVEDRETNRRLLVKLLEQWGFEVQEATNGQEAIDAWQRWNPHLIWMDMRMPVLNGREATKQIKSMPGGETVSIIALTATAFDEDREQILLDGCDDFVRKPFRKKEIIDILEKHLGVGFIYEKESTQIPGSEEASTSIELTDVQTLAALPPEWIEELHQATLRADLHHIMELISRICEKDLDLGKTLTNLAQNFEYQKILNLIESIGEGNE